jgi:hypothetical protein
VALREVPTSPRSSASRVAPDGGDRGS